MSRVPKGTPADVVQTLVEAHKKVVESQEFKAFAKTVAIIPSFKTGLSSRPSWIRTTKPTPCS